MKIIITKTRELKTVDDVNAAVAEFEAAVKGEITDDAAEAIQNDTVFFEGGCADVKVGYNKILVKRFDEDNFSEVTDRHNVAGMAIDGKPVILKGLDFHRIGCVRTDDEAAELIDEITRRENLQADAQRKINALKAEYADYQSRNAE